MAREVEKDWERAGDYLRAGLDGREYFQSPRPRWASLHDLQGLFDLWRITGDGKYRDAFIHHWRSIRRWDRRNTGAFSSGEQATGNPYAPTAIETCCTVAWIALTVDYLKLTGDPRAVGDLELATLNGGLGAQHIPAAVGELTKEKIPAVNLSRLAEVHASAPPRSQSALESRAWLQVDLPTEQGDTLRLVDFASAGR